MTGNCPNDCDCRNDRHWWHNRIVVLRPEAPDSDWGKLHVVPAELEDVTNMQLDSLVDELSQLTPEQIAGTA